jgi:uncharacterized protein (TIGR03032 family)
MVAEATLAEFGLDAPAPDGPTTASDPEPLRAVHTSDFPALLRQLGASHLVTTYQAGKLVMVRDEGDRLNTHFRSFQGPMGLALGGSRLALGTAIQVWEFADVPAVTARLDPPGRHDACFLPRASHVTSNIQIHEMAWGSGGELWVVNGTGRSLTSPRPVHHRWLRGLAGVGAAREVTRS